MSGGLGDRVHFVGVGGAGMSAIAKVLLERGVEVSGSDIKRSNAAARLEAMGASIHIGHDGALVDGCTAVVVSSAIPGTNPEVRRARALGTPVVPRGEALARVLDGTRSIVVAGTHGKTTTTSMIVSVLRHSGSDPTYLVGGELNDAGTNARHGGGRFAVAESDESDGSFLRLRPHIAVVTNVEADHLDFWPSLGAIRDAFARWVRRIDPDGAAVLPVGERGLAAESGARVLTYGDGGDVEAAGVERSEHGTSFVVRADGAAAEVALRVPGRHNVANALAAAAASRAAGIELDAIARGLREYRGVERRWHTRGRARGVTVIDEYAHHPTEVRASLEAARPGPWERVVAVFQPHRYSRTAALGGDFGPSFAPADVVVLTDVYGAGEQPVPGVTGKLVADAVAHCLPGRRLAYLPHRAELVAYLVQTVRPGDLLLTMGAGDISAVGDEVLARLEPSPA
ncbi:MAG TPA: UDP-N-acetylmuramate--L-alanine ligase [Actinomycetota bacterium]|nr:UDP-N-acetylmuramate--L-alanine ligase [Actinomycetota bacterium]